MKRYTDFDYKRPKTEQYLTAGAYVVYPLIAISLIIKYTTSVLWKTAGMISIGIMTFTLITYIIGRTVHHIFKLEE